MTIILTMICQIYAHNSTDVLSLERHNWLTGSIINSFLDTIDLNTDNGSHKKLMNILHTPFYDLLTTTLPGHVNTPQYNSYNIHAIQTFPDYLSQVDFLKTFIGHWILCIIDPRYKNYYIIDSMHTIIMK